MLLKCKYNKYKSIYFHSKATAHCNYEHFHCRKDKQMVDVFPKFLVSLKRPTFFFRFMVNAKKATFRMLFLFIHI